MKNWTAPFCLPHLEWVFERLPEMTNQQDLRELLPAAWLMLQADEAKSA